MRGECEERSGGGGEESVEKRRWDVGEGGFGERN